jgi:hypothetical protein
MNNRTSIPVIFAIAGVSLLVAGFSIKISLGVFVVYMVFSILMGIAHYKKAGPIIAMIFGGAGTALIIDITLHEALYFFGCISITYAVVRFIQIIQIKE